jgi:hypothetical protein
VVPAIGAAAIVPLTLAFSTTWTKDNPNAAVMRAEALSRKEGHVGAVAFSRTGDPATSNFNDAQVIRKFGDVPDDLSAL